MRAARQQDFLRAAKEQIGRRQALLDRKALLRIFGRYTQTDIRSGDAILRLFKLAFARPAIPSERCTSRRHRRGLRERSPRRSHR